MGKQTEIGASILDPATSREALLPYALDGAYRLEIVNEACRIAAEALRAEPKTSDWIEDEYGYSHCPKCGWEWDEPEMITPYCPSCGARMEEVSEWV